MKKILALILSVCMILGSISALADDPDFTGTWYLQTMGLTAGTFELNADGTCTLSTDDNGEEVKKQGTWSVEGETVTLTVDDQPLPMTYDGADLTVGEEAVAMLGGSEMSGMDPSFFSQLIKISREPGKITMAELDAYNTDGTIPEGKTKEDMDSIQAEMMTLVFSMMGSVGTGTSTGTVEGAGQTAAEDEANLTIAEENFYVRESYFGKECVYIAKVQNDTEDSLLINDGSMIIKDADGNEVAKREYLGTCGSRYLEPGEVSYVSMQVDLEEGKTADSYEAVVRASHNEYARKDTILEVDQVELRSKEGYSGTNYYTAATITNKGETPLAGISVLVVTRDSNGKMVDIGMRDLGMNELGAGSTITLVDDIDSAAVKYCEANQLTLEGQDACAWVDEAY
jgi:hypothetical protein